MNRHKGDCMRKKNIFTLSTMVLILLIISIFGIINYKNISQPYAVKIVEIIKEDKERALTVDELNTYEMKINEELQIDKSSKNTKLGYYALGAISYLKQDYNQSIDHLLKALEYTEAQDNGIELMIYSALSSNYIHFNDLEEAEKYFEKAKALAVSKEMEEQLCEIYYGRAKAMLLSEYNVDEVLDLMNEALKFTKTEEHKVRNYLFMASIYRLKGDSTEALAYTSEALRISLQLRDNELINRTIINIGEDYYIQKQYEKTIDIYEKLIESNRLTNDENKLTVYGYLVDSYARSGAYKNFKKYEEKYLSIVQTLDGQAKDKELLWLYTTCAEGEIEFSNITLAKEYLAKAEALYKKNKNNSYAHVEIHMIRAKIKIDYYENKDYIKTIENYEKLIKKIDKIGIELDVKRDIINEILDISYVNKDYDTLIKYVEQESTALQKEESNVTTDNIFDEINEIRNQNRLTRSKIRAGVLIIILIIMIYEIRNIRKKNKEIKHLNRRLEEANKIDSLTKVYNKGYLYETLTRRASLNEEITFVMIDIDYFKLYNDGYGHIKGDEVLERVATVIKEVCKEHLVFRYGGEEFSIISGYKLEDLIKDVERIQSEIYKANIAHEYSEVSDRITLSIGLAASSVASEQDIYNIIKAADKNLYKSKHAGRNQYNY